MTDKEKAATNPTEKKKEHVFVLGIGKGPKMRTLEFVFTPVEKDTTKDGEEPVKPKEDEEDTKKGS